MIGAKEVVLNLALRHVALLPCNFLNEYFLTTAGNAFLSDKEQGSDVLVSVDYAVVQEFTTPESKTPRIAKRLGASIWWRRRDSLFFIFR